MTNDEVRELPPVLALAVVVLPIAGVFGVYMFAKSFEEVAKYTVSVPERRRKEEFRLSKEVEAKKRLELERVKREAYISALRGVRRY